MEADLATLRARLNQEEEHLDLFVQSGQRMNASGIDTTDQYLAAVRDRIATLKQRIAAYGKGDSES